MHSHCRGLDQCLSPVLGTVHEPSTVITTLTANHRIFPSLSNVYACMDMLSAISSLTLSKCTTVCALRPPHPNQTAQRTMLRCTRSRLCECILLGATWQYCFTYAPPPTHVYGYIERTSTPKAIWMHNRVRTSQPARILCDHSFCTHVRT